MIGSRFHPDSSLQEQWLECQLITMSSSLKFGVVAEGEADVYPRFSPTAQWDTAAGQCILEVAGGQVVDFNQQPLRYNQQQSLLNSHFLASGVCAAHWQHLIVR